MSDRAIRATPGAHRIAYVLGTFPTLTETFVQREIAALKRGGQDIIVLALRRPDKSLESDHEGSLGPAPTCMYARPDSLVHHAIGNLIMLLRRPARFVRGLGLFLGQSLKLTPRETLQLLYHFFVGVGFARELRRLRVSHVHCHFTSAANVALAMHMVDDIAFSFTAHASNDLFVRPILLAEKTASARFVVAVCEYSRRYLDSVTGFQFSEKIHRIYNGIGSDELRLLTDAVRSGGGPERADGHPPRIVSVGSLVTPKGHATLIHVCARLRERGEDFTCHIVGEGPERSTLERLVAARELGGLVKFLGPLPLSAVYTELQRADVFVLLAEIGPSGYRDGFPTVILEAMAAGLPVLSTTLSGIPEIVVDGVTGSLVPERDIDAASCALERLLKSAELRQKMGSEGLARVKRLFTLEESAERLASLLHSDA